MDLTNSHHTHVSPKAIPAHSATRPFPTTPLPNVGSGWVTPTRPENHESAKQEAMTLSLSGWAKLDRTGS
jgi:hypothetical protein